MMTGRCRRTASFIAFILCIMILIIGAYISSTKLPIQKLKITAITASDEFDMYGTTNIYYFKSLNHGESKTATIKFMAVKNTSDDLFVSHGTGQYVHLGCSELKAEYNFITLGRFLHIKLTLNAVQTDLKLEDGTPFDITKYSLKPVLIIE